MRQPQHFDRYTLHTDPLKLTEGHRKIEVAQRALEVLAALVLAEGAVLSKQDLMDLVWKDTHVDAGNITQTIFLLRRTLGERHDGGAFIETVSGEG